MGDQASDGGAAGVVGAEDLPQEDPERHQGGEHPVEPDANGGQRLGDDLLGEEIGEGEATVLQELAPETADLFADRFEVRIAHLGGLLAGDGTVASLHLRKGGPPCLCHFGGRLNKDLRAIRGADRSAQCLTPIPSIDRLWRPLARL